MAGALPRPLRGIVPPLVTPLAAPDALDVPALHRVLDHVITGGVTGVFILGTTGEAPALSYRLRSELIERVCGHVQGRIPVLVGITDTSLTESLTLAQRAATAGADAVVAAAPYYFRPNESELLHYVKTLAGAVTLPLLLYSMPHFTKVPFSLEIIRAALEMPNVAGLKDSSGDMAFFHAVARLLPARPDWTLMVGPEHLTAEGVLFGAHGGVNGGSNLFPRLFVELYNAAAARDMERVSDLQFQVLQLGRVYQVGRSDVGFIKGLKCALAAAGLCPERMAEPFEPFGEPERERVRRLFAEMSGRWLQANNKIATDEHR